MDELLVRWGRDRSAHVRVWTPRLAPLGMVQILHGLAEHGGRYTRLAEALRHEGFAVYAQDLPGHGRSIRDAEERGHFADCDGWRVALDACDAVRDAMRREHPLAPLFLFGHGLGSLLAQDALVERGPRIAGAILSSTSGAIGSAGRAALVLLRAEAALRGPRRPSRVAHLLSCRRYNRRFRPVRTPFDWLSRDRAEIDRYIADPLCGFRPSTQLWIDLLTARGALEDPARLHQVPTWMPILLIAGTRDPVSNGLRAALPLVNAYRDALVADVTVRTYEGGRHDLLNDTCRHEVTMTLIDWLLSRADRRPIAAAFGRRRAPWHLFRPVSDLYKIGPLDYARSNMSA